MDVKNKTSSSSINNPIPKEALNYQLEILKKEIDIINQSMREIVNLTQTIKGWAITVWMGSISLFVAQKISQYVILSAIPPLLFWFVDAYWRTIQAQYAFRASKISHFLNHDGLSKSFEKGQLVNFVCFDTTGKSYKNSKNMKEHNEYKSYTSMKRTIRMPEVIGFYLPLMIISLALGIYFLLL